MSWDQHAFHHDKLLLDPYARRIYVPPALSRTAAVGDGGNLGRAPRARSPGSGAATCGGTGRAAP